MGDAFTSFNARLNVTGRPVALVRFVVQANLNALRSHPSKPPRSPSVSSDDGNIFNI